MNANRRVLHTTHDSRFNDELRIVEQPPKLAQRILMSFLREDLTEEVLGDLEEKFNSMVRNKSLFRARINYWYQY